MISLLTEMLNQTCDNKCMFGKYTKGCKKIDLLVYLMYVSRVVVKDLPTYSESSVPFNKP